MAVPRGVGTIESRELTMKNNPKPHKLKGKLKQEVNNTMNAPSKNECELNYLFT